MSQFYASIQGSHKKATRQGTKKSGISGHIRGWNVGVEVDCFTDSNGVDRCNIYATGGSQGFCPSILLGGIKDRGYGQPPEIKSSSALSSIT